MSEFGYAGEILKVNLSDGRHDKLATSEYAEKFLGGRGMAMKLYWDMVPPSVNAFDENNCLVIASGPVAGFPGFSGGRWKVCSKTAALDGESLSYANMGGRWGIRLKRSGYDGLIIGGKAESPVYLYIHDGSVEIRDASYLWGKTSFEACYDLKAELGKGVSILTIGQAAENLVIFATLFTDDGASGSGGLGSVMGSKNLKAIVVAGENKLNAAHPEKLREITQRLYRPEMDDILEFPWTIPGVTKINSCYGCGIGCSRQTYLAEDGHRFKSFCQPIDLYMSFSGDNLADSDEARLMAIRSCDRHGLDTCVMQPIIDWLFRCHREGILDDESTGLPISKIGSIEFIEELTRKIANREGFGNLLASGTLKTAESISTRAEELTRYSISLRSNEKRDYDPRLMLHNAILVAIEPRRPISQLHEASGLLMRWLVWLGRNSDLEGLPREIGGAEVSPENLMVFSERFWGSTVAADYTTYEGKALASKKIQDRVNAKESIVLCDLMWPFSQVSRPTDGLPDVEFPSEVFSAVTGRDLDEAELDKIGERIFNVQRAIMVRQGWNGRKDDMLMDFLHNDSLRNGELFYDPECLVPGPGGDPVSREGFSIDKDEFEKLKDEYYVLRCWDVESGLQTRSGLKDLGLDDIANDLEPRGLLK